MEFNTRDYMIFNIKKCDEKKIRSFLKSKISERFIRSSIKNKNIYLNGEVIVENKMLREKDILAVKFEDENLNGKRQFRDLDIIFENEDLIFVNKESGMVTHTAKDDVEDTLLNYMCDYFYRNNIKRKVRFVNRLDRDTSGIVIIAKNPYAQSFMTKEFSEDRVIKKYLAICEGILEKKSGFIEAPIALSDDGIRREVREDGKYSKTFYKVLEEKEGLSLLELRLYTGRTHQIRVHLKSIGHPIIGDTLYGNKSDVIDRQALHSYYLKLKLPRNNKEIEIITDMPKDFKKILV